MHNREISYHIKVLCEMAKGRANVISFGIFSQPQFNLLSYIKSYVKCEGRLIFWSTNIGFASLGPIFEFEAMNHTHITHGPPPCGIW